MNKISDQIAKVFVLLLMIVLCTGSSCMEHTHCDDTTISKHISPDGKYIATLYRRSCAAGTGRYTCVKIEEMSGGEIGYIMTIREFYPITANWKDAKHLEISTPGLTQQKPDELAAFPPKNSWKDITVTYKPSE